MAKIPVNPIEEAIKKALKMAGASAKSSAGKVVTKAERKAAAQAKAAAERAAKTTASRASRAERKVANRKRFAEEADAAVATRYGRGDTRLQKAKGEVATEIDRIFRVAEGTDPIVRRTGARRKAVEKAINKMQDYMTKEGYGKLSFGEKVRIAKDTISGAKRANVAAGKRLEGTVKYYKGKESAPLKELGPKTVKAGSSKKPASKQTKLQREAARSVRQAKKEGRETVVREAARRAIRKEAKGQKLVEISDAKITADQAKVDRALAASRQKKLMAQAKKKRLAEMQERAPSKRKKESVKETESSKRLRAAQEKNAKDVVDPRFKKMTPAQQKRSQERLRADAKRLRNVSTSSKGMSSEQAQAELKRLGERGLETYGKTKAKPVKGRKPVTWVRDSSGKLVPKKK